MTINSLQNETMEFLRYISKSYKLNNNVFSASFVTKLFISTKDLISRLMILINLSSGSPCRGTELCAMTFSNDS